MFIVFDQVRHKPGCTTSEDGQRLEISDVGSRGIILYMNQLICAFVCAYAQNVFSYRGSNNNNNNQSRTNGPLNAHLTIAQVMPKYNHNNEKQEALL